MLSKHVYIFSITPCVELLHIEILLHVSPILMTIRYMNGPVCDIKEP